MGFEQPGTIVYTPDSALRRPIQLLRSLARDLGKSRELATTLLMRNLKAQYRQTILGCLWAFLRRAYRYRSRPPSVLPVPSSPRNLP